MKNIRLLVRGLSLLFAMGLGSNALFADDQPAPGKAKLKVERKEITKEQAAALVASGEKVTLGVYLVLDAGWKTVLESGAVNRIDGMMSFGFFEDETYTQGYFLQNPVDYIEICADPGVGTDGYLAPPRGTCCTNPITSDEVNWYTSVTWQKPGATNNGVTIGWPDYAYGMLLPIAERRLLPLEALRPVYKFWQINDDGTYEFKLYDIQFILKRGDRSFPVAILDDGIQVQGALGASELRILNGANDYWPSNAYNGSNKIAADWTGLINHGDFEFVPGGLFIENGPEVRTFEPSFLS